MSENQEVTDDQHLSPASTVEGDGLPTEVPEGDGIPEENTATKEIEDTANPKKPDVVKIEEFNKVYGKMKAAERKIAELESKKPEIKEVFVNEDQPPKQESYDTYEDYMDARLDWKLKQTEKVKHIEEETRVYKSKEDNLKSKIEEERLKNPDYNNKALIPGKLVDIFMETEEPIKLSYYFGEHPEEARRIIQLSPTKAAIEIAKLELKLTSIPPKKNETKAPDPIQPVGNKNNINTEDVLSKKHSTEEFIAERNRLEIERRKKGLG